MSRVPTITRLKQQPGNTRPNPAQLSKELVDSLCSKSSFLYRRKWKWRAMCANSKATPEQIDNALGILVDKKIQAIKEYNEKRSANSNSGRNDNVGSGNGGDNIGSSASTSEISESRTQGEEVRSVETQDESLATRGS